MTVTIGSLTIRRLQAQPFGYEEGETSRGQTSRLWDVVGLVEPEDWIELIGIYDDWQADRITDPDPLTSETVGTTVAFSAAANGLSWSSIPVWFVNAPAGEQVGPYVRVAFSVVAAADQLAVLLAQKEAEASSEDADTPDYGTYELAGVTLALLDELSGWEGSPEPRRAMSGTMVIEGALTPVEVNTINGWTDAAGRAAIDAWYPGACADTYATGDWTPASPPAWSRDVKVISGIRTERHVLTMTFKRF